jgi:hypothetical protein
MGRSSQIVTFRFETLNLQANDLQHHDQSILSHAPLSMSTEDVAVTAVPDDPPIPTSPFPIRQVAIVYFCAFCDQSIIPI